MKLLSVETGLVSVSDCPDVTGNGGLNASTNPASQSQPGTSCPPQLTYWLLAGSPSTKITST